MSTRNIMRAWRAGTVTDHADGRDWYPRASRLAAELDPFNLPRGAAIVAIPSPMTSWALNVRLSRLVAELAHDGGTYDEILSGMDGMAITPANRAKLAAVLTGADPDLVVSGPKVRPFWQLIMDPWNVSAVVVDRHAIDIYAGRPQTDKQRAAMLRNGGRLAIQESYARAARIISREEGIPTSPADAQAGTWLYWRRERAQANHGRNDANLIP